MWILKRFFTPLIPKPNSTTTCTNGACGNNPQSRVPNLEQRFQAGGSLCWTLNVTGLTIHMNSVCFDLGADVPKLSQVFASSSHPLVSLLPGAMV